LSTWTSFLNGADRLALDWHPYFAFSGLNSDVSVLVPQPCNSWGGDVNSTQQTFGIVTAGEFSAAINDCGLFVNGVPDSHSSSNCATWDNWQNWDQATKDNFKAFVLTSMEALQNWFFWTWKIGNSTQTGTVSAPFWAYQLGLQNGWIPTDPREAVGKCASIGQAMNAPFNGVFLAWQTGGDPAAQPTVTSDYDVWPPKTLGSISPASWLPTYTPTAPIITLAGPVVTNGVNGGDGWYDKQDTTGMMAPIAGCNYPDAYNAATLPAPIGPVCGQDAVPQPTAVTSTKSKATTTDPRGVPTATSTDGP